MKVTRDELLAVMESAGVSVDVSAIKSDTLLNKTIDSLEMMNVFLAVEEKYGIKISDEDTEALATIGDIIAYLQQK